MPPVPHRLVATFEYDALTGDDYLCLPQELSSIAGLVDEDSELVEAAEEVAVHV